ncbi:plasmid partitioning protein RepB [Methylobacterium frigidaeris]|uniref:Nucleoid occlusion protein n=1 Tax=Methylobacterium frigidaeris TaxID=2038277 RepID=A0AA37M8P9_9HYPH|nr:plasmid partitioning protein RepB [Methylobacterium frigidaeris]GJD66444.1 Nucleoid occlusion protein [Methylobacterium frigidaeris]
MSRARRSLLDIDEDIAAGRADGGGSVEVGPPFERQPRRVGAVRDMDQSIGLLEKEAAELERIKALLASGGAVVELDTSLVDPSAFRERLDYDVSDLTRAIQARGQIVPILVRPHPEEEGRYQIAYGNRRHAVCHELKRPVRAVVKDLSDAEMIVAQGQENAARKDLTFIEQARFVANLRKVHPAIEVQREIGIDESLMHRMVRIVAALPEALIQIIGRADRIGRPRWDKLAEEVKKLREVGTPEEDIVARAKAAVDAAKARTKEPKPHTLFEVVFDVFVSGKPRPVLGLSVEGGGSLGKVVSTATGSNLKLNDQAFMDHLVEQLPELYRQYREKRGLPTAGIRIAAE